MSARRSRSDEAKVKRLLATALRDVDGDLHVDAPERPLIAEQIRVAVETLDVGKGGDPAIAAMLRAQLRNSLVLDAWRRAGSPVDVEPYRPEPPPEDPRAMVSGALAGDGDRSAQTTVLQHAVGPVGDWLAEIEGSLLGAEGYLAATPAEMGPALRATADALAAGIPLPLPMIGQSRLGWT